MALCSSHTLFDTCNSGQCRDRSDSVHAVSFQVFGAEQLLKRSSAAPLAMTKVFSSLAAFSGSGGQGSYASANGVLDSWAAVNQARQLIYLRNGPALLTCTQLLGCS